MMIVVGNAILGPGNGTHLHADRGVHGVSGHHRHHAFLHEHRRARYLRDGQRRRSSGAFRLAALRKPDAAPRDLDAGRDFGGGGCSCGVLVPFGDAGALPDAAIKALPQGLFSSVGYMSHDAMAALPNTLLTVTLASNFGTFLLYMLSCFICIVAYPRASRTSASCATRADPGLRTGGQLWSAWRSI